MKIACYIRNIFALEQVQTCLQRSGFESIHFDSEISLLRTLKRHAFDIVIIDIANAASEGDSIFSWLNVRTERIPTLILSPLRTAELVAQAIDKGADDFLLRPFESIELILRINTLIRRCISSGVPRTVEFAGFSLDCDTAQFSFRGKPIALTTREFCMAWLFFSSPGRSISREALGNAIGNPENEVPGRIIEQHICSLRKKLVVDDRQVVMIRTACSHGYRLELCSGNDAANS